MPHRDDLADDDDRRRTDLLAYDVLRDRPEGGEDGVTAKSLRPVPRSMLLTRELAMSHIFPSPHSSKTSFLNTSVAIFSTTAVLTVWMNSGTGISRLAAWISTPILDASASYST
jgi:hypothetical protein